jgi:hypothetical protein
VGARRVKLGRSVAEIQPVKSSDLPALLFVVFFVFLLDFFVFFVEIVIIDIVIVVRHVRLLQGFGGVRDTGAAAVAAASPDAAAAAGACAVGAGVVAPGVAGGGVAGFAPGADAYVVQKCRPQRLHTQNCCGVHGCPGAGSFISICSPQR